MQPVPNVMGPKALSNSFLGDVLQICVVTRDHRRTMEGMVRLGIGPWEIRTYDRSNLSDTTYCGQPAMFSMRICIANTSNMNWEIVEPLSGPSIYADFLAQHGEGVQHIAFSWRGIDYDEKIRQFAEHGYVPIQAGRCFGECRFHYFATEDDIGTVFETFYAPEGFVFPEPEGWYPAPPTRTQPSGDTV